MLDPAMLRLLALIEATGSLAGAADELGITPAGVTQQVARLERQVGGPVVTRGPRGARLAPVGLALAEHGRRIDEATGPPIAPCRGRWAACTTSSGSGRSPRLPSTSLRRR
jgi:molybdate transport repressor ModE-like protein